MQGSLSSTALVLDDHAIIRQSCRELLEQENIPVVWDGTNGNSAFDAYVQLQPSVCIIDLSLKGKSGFETIKNILNYDSHAKIIVFSMHSDAMFVSKVINSGVSGYVSKTSQPSDLVTAVKKVLAGLNYLSNDIDNDNALSFDQFKDDLLSSLTEQEKNIFLYTVEGMNSTKISQALNISTKSVSHHLYNIKQKLGAKNIPELIKIAICHNIELENIK